MPTRRTILTAGTLVAVSVAAMAWAAAKPGNGIGNSLLVQTQSAMTDVADWYRRSPADGNPDWEEASRNIYDADADHGATLMINYGCGACHAIPGVVGANGSVGPSLEGFARQAYVAGVLPNEPAGLTRWLVNPVIHSPRTAMPDLGVTEADARDMAAYLYTLRGR